MWQEGQRHDASTEPVDGVVYDVVMCHPQFLDVPPDRLRPVEQTASMTDLSEDMASCSPNRRLEVQHDLLQLDVFTQQVSHCMKHCAVVMFSSIGHQHEIQRYVFERPVFFDERMDR